MIHDVPSETLSIMSEIKREIAGLGNIKSELEMAGFSHDEIADLMIQPEEIFEPDYGMVTELREFGARPQVRRAA